MEQPEKQGNITEESSKKYRPVQQLILDILQWGAWTSVFIAIMFAITSQ